MATAKALTATEVQQVLDYTANHQIHHRGQITTLLTQLGVDLGSTDLPFMPQFDHEASMGM